MIMLCKDVSLRYISVLTIILMKWRVQCVQYMLMFKYCCRGLSVTYPNTFYCRMTLKIPLSHKASPFFPNLRLVSYAFLCSSKSPILILNNLELMANGHLCGIIQFSFFKAKSKKGNDLVLLTFVTVLCTWATK